MAKKASQKGTVKKLGGATKVRRGMVYIQATFNNVLITVTDLNGNTIAWSSSGLMKFKGSRRSTPYAAQMAARNAAEKAKDRGMEEIEIIVRGVGIGRESAIRAFVNVGYALHSITDMTPVPHNGCRPRKKRRM